MKIRNYIRHAVRDLAPLFMSDEDEFNEYQHIVFDKGQTSDHIICDKGRTFDHICFQDCLEKLKAKRPEVWNFVCKLQEGMTSTEIAEEEKTSRSSINFKYMRVLKSEFVRRLFQ
jgi:hypothetical protein